MPTLIAEDGTGLSLANSYVTVEEADAYFSTHPFYADNWSADLGVPDKESVLVTATALLDALFHWYGTIVSPTQALGWPRVGVYDNELRPLSNSVPRAVKIATMEMAVYSLLHGDVFAPAASVGVDRLKIDVIELQFSSSQNGGSRALPPVPAAAVLAVRSLGEYTLGNRVRKVVVG